MSTIIAHKGQLIADRRKVVDGAHISFVGIRDEAKIHQTDFCLFGLSGFEISSDIPAFEGTDLKLLRALAVIFGLTYFTQKSYLHGPVAKALEEHEYHPFVQFRRNVRSLRNILASQLAKELEKDACNVLAVGREHTLMFHEGKYGIYGHQTQAVIGAGRKMAAILLDHGVPYEDIYRRLRWSGLPTGATFDVLKASDLPDLMPPVWDSEFLLTMHTRIKRQMQEEKEEGVLTPELEQVTIENVTKIFATFLTMGRGKDKRSVALRPTFDFSTPEARKRKAWKSAVAITRYKPKDEQAK